LANTLPRLASSLCDVPKDKQNATIAKYAPPHNLFSRPANSTNCRCRLSDTYYIIKLVAEDAFCLGTEARVPYSTTVRRDRAGVWRHVLDHIGG